MPLKGVPFGREWTFRGAPGSRSGEAYFAELLTSCIDVNAPHRACHWMPLDSPATATAAAAAPRRLETRVHRGTYAACWTVGALALIGWLVVTHVPPASLVATAREAQSTASAAPDAARATAAMTARTSQLAERHTATERVGATMISSPDAMPAAPADASPSAAADRRDTAPARDATPLAEPQPQALAATERQPAPTRRTAAPAVPPTGDAQRVVTRPRPAPPPVRTAMPAEPPAHDDALDDPRTLIEMADALRAEWPAVTRAAPSSGTNADWSARLTHRRLTDAPDAFAR